MNQDFKQCLENRKIIPFTRGRDLARKELSRTYWVSSRKTKLFQTRAHLNTRETIVGEFLATMSVLAPLKIRIEATDKLIDQIVYKLYGLTDDEIAIVGGQYTKTKPV